MTVRSLLRGVRARLTVSYVVATVMVLAVYAVGVYAVVSRNVSRSLDAQVRADFMWAAEMWDERPDGSLAWFDDFADDEDDPWLQVWGGSDVPLYQSAMARRIPLPRTRALALQAGNDIVRVEDGSVTYRVLSRTAVIRETSVVIQVARSEAGVRRELWDLLVFLLLGLPAGVVASALGGYVLARRALAPVDWMVERARTITAERLHDRLPVHNPDDELGRLAGVFNRLLERLEHSFQQMHRFTADVSHELRTPLTAMRAVGEVALQEPRSAQAYRAAVGSMLEEGERLTRLVERLLALSRADAAGESRYLEHFDLGELAEAIVAHVQVLAEEKQQSLRVDQSTPTPCEGDREMVRQAVINLVDNAIKYSPEGGSIVVQTRAAGAHNCLEVLDDGPGIDPDRGERIFDRFYRGTATPDGSSLGLGLAITKAVVTANGGHVAWEPRPQGGSLFRIVLPLAAEGDVPAVGDAAAPETVAGRTSTRVASRPLAPKLTAQ